MLRALLQNCPVCKRDIKGHFFAQVASAIVNDSSKPVLARLFSSVRQHEWDRVAEFKEWDALADNVVVYIIRGDHADGIILVVKDVFELYASNDLILLERITDADLEAISGQVALEWQQVWVNASPRSMDGCPLLSAEYSARATDAAYRHSAKNEGRGPNDLLAFPSADLVGFLIRFPIPTRF
jgi:hypothetical protein